MTVRIGVAWATHFQRKPLQGYPRLRYGYRPASLFLQAMIEAGEDAGWVGCDEQLVAGSLDPGGAAQQVDILYVSSHGGPGANGYEIALHAADWPLLGGGFGVDGPTVVVFDCCDLADVKAANWEQHWSTPLLGKALRLVLGFSTRASGSRKPAIRGTAFADELARQPITDAWCTAVHNSTVTAEKPVAIALGDDRAEADAVLNTMTSGALYGPRTVSTPIVATRP
jgi:hypothetical protein